MELSSLAEVMMATVTRVRRNTASMTSPWLYLGTITPSFTVYPPMMRLAGTLRAKMGARVEIGRASGRERGEIPVGAVSLKKKKYDRPPLRTTACEQRRTGGVAMCDQRGR